MCFLYKNKKFRGEIYAYYFVWYGLGRSIIEGFRSDSLWLFGEGTIRVSQALGIVTCAIGVVIMVFGFLKAYNNIDVWGMLVSKLPKKNTH